MKLCPVILCIVVSTSCLEGNWDDHPISYLASPDGKFKALVMERKGPVTTRTFWYLKVLRSAEQIDDGVGSLAIRTPYYVTPADARNIARIDIQWASNDSLIASIDRRAEILTGAGRGVPDGVRLVVRTRDEPTRRP